jgi:hypothetical protein
MGVSITFPLVRDPKEVACRLCSVEWLMRGCGVHIISWPSLLKVACTIDERRYLNMV